jgi:large subunit ribosomal protein L29
VAELDAASIRELTEDEIAEEIGRVQDELFQLKFRAAYEELENPSLIKTLRRDLARLKTIRHEKRFAKEENDE